MTTAEQRGVAAPNVPPGITERRFALPVFIFAVSLLAYGISVVGAVLATSLGVKIALAILAGAFTSNLAIIGHDGVHRSSRARNGSTA